MSVAWPTGVKLLVFFCSSVSVVLFDTPGVSRCRSQHVFLSSPHLCFIVFIFVLLVFRDDPLMGKKTFTRTQQLYVFSNNRSRGRDWNTVKTGLSPLPSSILILAVPRRYFCCFSLLLFVLAVRIYTLVQLLCC